MKGKFLSIFLVIYVTTLNVYAQDFATEKLAYLYNLLGKDCNLSTESGLFNSSTLQHPLSVEYNDNSEIKHLGVSLFDKETKNYFGETICNFHERIFLELILLSDIEMNKICKEYGINIFAEDVTGNQILSKKDLNSILHFIKQDEIQYILVKDSLMWTSTWKDKTRKIEINFPATFSLLSGTDKKEADILFEQEITKYSAKKIPQALLLLNRKDLELADNGFFVKKGKSMFIKSMMSNLYFRYKQGDGYSLVFDSRYPLESLSNLFMHPDINAKKLTINVEHKTYGNESKTNNLNLYDFLLFLDKDFETYIGIEQYTSEQLKFTILFRNLYYNCHHLLYVETTPNTIFESKGTLKGTLYTYIPNHNIKDMFKKDIEDYR